MQGGKGLCVNSLKHREDIHSKNLQVAVTTVHEIVQSLSQFCLAIIHKIRKGGFYYQIIVYNVLCPGNGIQLDT